MQRVLQKCDAGKDRGDYEDSEKIKSGGNQCRGSCVCPCSDVCNIIVYRDRRKRSCAANRKNNEYQPEFKQSGGSGYFECGDCAYGKRV